MSVTEILEELPRLLPEDRVKVSRYLRELEILEKEETPEMLTAIDSGRRSLKEDNTYTLEQARASIARWTTR